MKLLIAVTVFLSIIFLTSCGTTNGVTGTEKITLDSWIGSTRAELIKSWGRPTKETPDDKGGEIITYDTTIVYHQTSGTNYQNGNREIYNKAANSYAVTKSRMFYINPSAIIYRWDAKEKQGY